MPSSNKTLNLSLNKWLGSDKPKKDDFNADNQKLDDAWKTMNTTLTNASASINGHTGNTGIHITAAERAAWNGKDKFITGSYKGDGANTRKITLGFAPRFGYLYAENAAMIQMEFDNHNMNILSGAFSADGSSLGLSVDATGFTVTNNPTARPNGHTMRYNDTAYTYRYVVWQ